jgi:hypothetical protein
MRIAALAISPASYPPVEPVRESGIGRVLVATLHQAIGDSLPARLVFYENFLVVQALRDGTIGLAPLSAVLSFLRQEGPAYDQIMTRAGHYAAEWTVESMTPFERSTMASAPIWLRTRLVLRVARQLVRRSCDTSRMTSRLRRGSARIELRDSVFCTVREKSPVALCGFYAAAFTRLMALFDLPANARVAECRSQGATACILTLTVSDTAVIREGHAA